MLSIFHSIYAFIRKEYYTPSRLWDSVREELIAFRGLMIFLQSDWARPWNDLVACSDSSTTGYGVSTAYWPRGTVGECGRILERTRFKRVGGCDARESALTSAGFVRDSVTGDWVAGDIPSSEYLDKSGWSLDQILTLEARALVKSLKRIAMSIFGHDVRQLLLVDNMSVCLAFDRSRARNFPLLVQIRRFASYCLARNIQCSVRWVPSELNNSDSPSRYYSDEPSKLLTDAIPGCKPGQEGEDFEGPLPKESRRGDTKDQDPQAIHGLKLFNSNAIVEEAQPDTSLVDTQEFRRHFGLGGRARLGCGGHPDEEKEESRQQFKQHQLNPKSQGEKDVGQPEKQGTASIQAHGGSAYGRSEPIAVGESSSDGEHFKAVFPGAQPVHGLWPAKRVGHQGRSDDGWDDGRVPEPDVPSRPSVLSGGPPDCSRAPLYYPEYGRMGAKRLPRTWRCHSWLSQGLSSGPVVCHGGGAEEAREAEDVSVPHVVRIDLCSALGIVEGPSVLHGQASFGGHRTLVDASVTRRARNTNKDWRVRRQPDPRFPISPKLGGSSIRGVEEGTSRGEAVGVRLWGVQSQLQRGSKASGCRGHAISDKALRTIHRQEPQLQVPTRSPTSRPMAIPEVSQQVREECKAGCNLGTVASSTKEPLPTMRSRPWGISFRPKGAARLSQREGLRGSRKYFLDLFAGSRSFKGSTEAWIFC